MRKLTIVVGLGAFPVTIVGGPEIEDELPRPTRVEAHAKKKSFGQPKRHGGACQLEWCSSRARGPSDAWGYTPHTSQSKAATRYGTWQTPATSPTCPGKRSAKPKRHGGVGQLEWCSSPDRGASGAGGYTLPMPLTTHGNRYGTAVAPATSPNCPGNRSAQIAPTALRPWHAHGRTTVPAPDPVPARPCARARI